MLLLLSNLVKIVENIFSFLPLGGGVKFTATCKLTKLGSDPRKTVYAILHEYKYHNCEILVREDITIDQFIDVIEVIILVRIFFNFFSGKQKICKMLVCLQQS